GNKKCLFILNKIDLVDKNFAKSLSRETGYPFIPISAKSGVGFADLEDALKGVVSGEFSDCKNSFLADVRVLNILDSAIERMNGLSELFGRHELPEIIAFELDELVAILSEVTGEITPDDVLGSIFSRFCIGK
ncbi:MAG TPA: tRNA uridine-5-carboxymethylaminomethyl(34) synthesis GTPase MnmE, partial [Spirochaetota bacterium]|nr:tRNA uridine-5-carboxymethylaminomethyl(34) synthesis GTPase MnmE [Spirochaetota bacterium]